MSETSQCAEILHVWIKHVAGWCWPLWHSLCQKNVHIPQVTFLPFGLLQCSRAPSKGPVCVNTGSGWVSPGETDVLVPSCVWSKSEWGETKTDKKTGWVKETSQKQRAENNTFIIISGPAVDALELIRSTKPCRNNVCSAGQKEAC